jgi:hypothetical protein
MEVPERIDEDAVRRAVSRQQSEPEEHDIGLIRERLRWTFEERLEANASFVRWYLSIRPAGPLLR